MRRGSYGLLRRRWQASGALTIADGVTRALTAEEALKLAHKVAAGDPALDCASLAFAGQEGREPLAGFGLPAAPVAKPVAEMDRAEVIPRPVLFVARKPISREPFRMNVYRDNLGIDKSYYQH